MHTLRLKQPKMHDLRPLTGMLLIFAATLATLGHAQERSPVVRVAVVFRGGHDTDPRDRERPVILVTSALGVPPEIFRDAFTHVHPAPAGMQPSPEEVQANKAALLSKLGPYGVTNDRLHTVSNYYRYVRSRGELWPTTPAVAYALVKRRSSRGIS